MERNSYSNFSFCELACIFMEVCVSKQDSLIRKNIYDFENFKNRENLIFITPNLYIKNFFYLFFMMSK